MHGPSLFRIPKSLATGEAMTGLDMPRSVRFSVCGRVEKGLCFVPLRVSAPNANSSAPSFDPSKSEIVLGLLDTGAQTSVVSMALARLLKLQLGPMQSVVGVHGTAECPTALAYFEIISEGATDRPRCFRVSVSEHKWPRAIIGTDLLAEGVFTFHGPTRTWGWELPGDAIENP